MHHQWGLALAVVLATILLGGCGGGDDGLVTPPGPHEPEPLTSNPPFSQLSPARQLAEVELFENDEEYGGDFPDRDPDQMIPRNALAQINAAWLYARGRFNGDVTPRQNGLRTAALQPKDHQRSYGRGTGAGVTIGILDSGLDHNHPNFQGRVHQDSTLAFRVNPRGVPENQIRQLSREESQLPQSRIIRRYAAPGCTRNCPMPFFRYHESAPPGFGGTLWRLPTTLHIIGPGTNGGFEFGDRGDIDLGHGNAVTSVAAGAKGAGRLHGVAYEAGIHFITIRFGGFPPEYTPIVLPPEPLDDFDLLIGRLNQTSDVINYSFGYAGGIEPGITETGREHPGYTAAELRRAFPRTIAARAEAHLSPADRTIHVVGAGNAGLEKNAVSTSPEIFPGMVAVLPELQSNNLAVVSVNARTFTRTSGEYIKDELSLFSNQCGIAKQWCLAAPGGAVIADGPLAYDNEGGDARLLHTTVSGTSFSAPYVTGAIAALISYFNGQLGNHEIVQRVLRTANKTGIYADSDMYGQGLLDLKAASEPYGSLRVPTGESLNGVGKALDATRLHSSPAFGDAWQTAFAGHHVSTFDELDAPFEVALGDLAGRVASARDPRTWLELGQPELVHRQGAFGESWSFSGSRQFFVRPAGQGFFYSYGVPGDFAFGVDQTRATSAPYLALENTFSAGFGRSGGFQMAAFHGTGESTGRPAYGLTLGWHPSPTLRFGTGFLHEEQGLLGSAGDGALATSHAGTWFAGADWRRKIGPWQGNVATWFGLSNPQDSTDGLIDYHGPLLTSQIRMTLSREHVFRSQDRFSLVLEQPLRVEHGQATLHYPSGRTRYGELLIDELSASLSPTGREWQWRTTYRRPIPNGMLEMGVGVSSAPGHVRHADPIPFAALKIGWDF